MYRSLSQSGGLIMEKAHVSSMPVLIVDDEQEAIMGCEFMLQAGGIANTEGCNDSRTVMSRLQQREYGLVLLDLSMPHITGAELLPKIAFEHPDVPVIILTGANDVDTAVECMRLGAFDYMVKPVEEARLLSGIRRGLELRELRREYDTFKNKVLTNELRAPEAFAKIVTRSTLMRSLFQYAETIAQTDRPILITGDTGVGKELMAEAIHRASGREGQLVTVNVAGLDDTVFSDTLFGHFKGSFTGAATTRKGLVRTAEGGTLFLDEIGDLTAASQVKLLRLTQERTFYPLGADAPFESSARIIVATNCDLEALTSEGRFRRDLFYRLKAHRIHIPPLRERAEDIPLLLGHFIESSSRALGKKPPTPPRALYSLLSTYGFPGNVRELEGMVFDAVSRHTSRVMSMSCFHEHIQQNQPSAHRSEPQGAKPGSPFVLFDVLPTVREAQAQLIEEALRRADNNQSLAARLIGMTQSGLSKALKRAREATAEE